MNDKEKIKLDIKSQIEYMKNKGIQFNLCSEEKARLFLQNNTYYFKLKSYEKNYSNDNREHKYKDLEFTYLIELSKIDMYLRKLILDMCLDIEHLLKTRLIYDCTINENTDGFDIVSKFLDNEYPVKKSIIDKAKSKSACSSLALKYYDPVEDDLKPIPLWIIVELLSFGDFIKLYTLYYQEFHRYPDYSTYLGSIKYLRNACAHNNCLINSLKKQKDFSKTSNVMNALAKAKKHIKDASRSHKMEIPVIHDFVTLLFVYNDLLNTPYNRRMRNRKMDEIYNFFINEDGRIKLHSDYFKNNLTLMESYEFICNVLEYINKMNNKPGFNRFLKTR